ncbi:MAG: Fic family protein [Jatrophihabitantaceae bacterium]
MAKSDVPASVNWPPHRHEARAWRQANRGGTKEDRMLRSIKVSLPPMIASQDLSLDSALVTDVESAMREISKLDATYGADLEALGVLLLRTESVASSKIEAVEASLDDYARALHGIRTNSSAVSMVAATAALDAMINDVTRHDRIELAAITCAHDVLMRDDPGEAPYAGRLRTVQNWIGGSNYSPRGALYVPPPPTTVPDYMNDLVTFANRDDLPALVQAAIAHAQFESIHPFTDGNGRIGRALINTVLRRRGATTRVVIPLASALVTRRERYFDLLTAYRTGDVRPLIATFAESSRIAAAESRITAGRLGEIPDDWRATVRARAGSAAAQLLAQLPSRPIVSSEDASAIVDAPRSSVFAAINRLHDVGVLRPLTDRKRDQVWGASLILDELEDLSIRIGQAAL